jgi:hypothetical protein
MAGRWKEAVLASVQHVTCSGKRADRKFLRVRRDISNEIELLFLLKACNPSIRNRGQFNPEEGKRKVNYDKETVDLRLHV